MASAGDSYKHYIPDIGLSIEKNTQIVPHDGKYHLLRNEQILKSYKTLKQAEIAFKGMVAELGYKPKPVKKQTKSAAEQNVERYLDAKDVFWAEGPISRDKGGRGGRGGV